MEPALERMPPPRKTSRTCPDSNPRPSRSQTPQPQCLPPKFNDLCADRRVYVHAVCLSGGHAKRVALEKLGLWFVRVYALPGDVGVVLPRSNGLPCASQDAWRGAYTDY